MFKYKKVHIIGIGGVSTSAIAKILLSKGYTVSGSDISRGDEVVELEKLGIKVYPVHKAENVKPHTTVIYSLAISKSEPELVKSFEYAQNGKGQVLSRGEAIGIISAEYKDVIAIAGTHGKTTTTGLVASVLSDYNMTDGNGTHKKSNPTVMIGGNTEFGNLRIGNTDQLVIEACEYKNSFTYIRATIAVILNTGLDHIDFYKNEQEILDAYIGFASNSAKYVLLNSDDINTPYIIKTLHKKAENAPQIITFGIKNAADYQAKCIASNEGKYCFIVDETKISLAICGYHNIYNALVAYAIARLMRIDTPHIIRKLYAFKGVSRRMQHVGSINDSIIYNDYAHHPVEIAASIKTLKQMHNNKKLAVIFQPHTYTRTKFFWNELRDALSQSDLLVLNDIYPAREKPIENVTSQILASEIKMQQSDTFYMQSLQEILSFLQANVDNSFITLILGAGDMPQKLQQLVRQQ